MLNRLKFLGVAAIALASVPVGAATMISQTVTLSQTLLGANSTVAFAQFNPVLGTLDSVELSFTATSAVSVEFRNNTPNNRNYSISPNFTATVAGLGLSGVSTCAPAGITFTQLPRISAGTPRTDTVTFNGSQSGNASTTTPAAGFVGTGTLSLIFSPTGVFGVIPANNTTVGGVRFNGNVVLRYNYTEVGVVPEPATWTMLIAGMGVVGVALRRRRLAEMRA